MEQNMKKSDFTFDLPKELIAQEPCSPRDAARLLRLGRESGAIEHRVFHDLPQLLRPGDLLVVNNSKVLPARLIGHKEGTGAVCELAFAARDDARRVGMPCPAGQAPAHGQPRCVRRRTRCAPRSLQRARTATRLCAFRTIRRRCTKSWMRSGKCRCRPTSKSSWTTRASTRPSTPRSWAAPRRPRRACTSRPH